MAAKTANRHPHLTRERAMGNNTKSVNTAALTIGWLQAFFAMGGAILLSLLGGMFYLGNTLGTMTNEIAHINKTLDTHTATLERVQTTLTGMDKHLDRLEGKLDARLTK